MPDYSPVTPLASGSQVPATEWAKIVADLQLHQNVETVRPGNDTGGTVTRGYVGVLDASSANSLVAASAHDNRRVVVVQDPSVAVTALVYCQMLGRCGTVNVTGAVNPYDPLETSGTPGYAHVGSAAPFAFALEAWAGPGNSTIQAMLLPAMAGAGFPVDDPSATHGPASAHLTGTSVNHLVAAPGAGFSIYVTKVRVIQNNTTASILTVKDTGAPVHSELYPFPGVQGSGIVDPFDPPWKLGDNLGLDAIQASSGDLYLSVNHYVAAS